MTNETKYTLSKWLIFIAAFSSILGSVYEQFFQEKYPYINFGDPHSILADIIMVAVCAILLCGLYFGSRGLGSPLSLKLLIHLFFTYPTRIILIPYFGLIIGSIIYYEFFW